MRPWDLGCGERVRRVLQTLLERRRGRVGVGVLGRAQAGVLRVRAVCSWGASCKDGRGRRDHEGRQQRAPQDGRAAISTLQLP